MSLELPGAEEKRHVKPPRVCFLGDVCFIFGRLVFMIRKSFCRCYEASKTLYGICVSLIVQKKLWAFQNLYV